MSDPYMMIGSQRTLAPNRAVLAELTVAARKKIADGLMAQQDGTLELGKILIPIRQALEAENGKAYGSRKSADGLSPKGWGKWLDVAGINRTTAHHAIRRAVNPDEHREMVRQQSQDGRRNPSSIIRPLRRAWPNWTADQQQDFIDAVTAIATENSNDKA